MNLNLTLIHFALAILISWFSLTSYSVTRNDPQKLFQTILSSSEQDLKTIYPACVEGYIYRKTSNGKRIIRQKFVFFDKNDTEVCFHSALPAPSSTPLENVLSSELKFVIVANPFYQASITLADSPPPVLDKLDARNGRFMHQINLAGLGRYCETLMCDFRDLTTQGRHELETKSRNGRDILVLKWQGVPAWNPSIDQVNKLCEFEFDLQTGLCFREKVVSENSGDGSDSTMTFDESGNLTKLNTDWIKAGRIDAQAEFNVTKLDRKIEASTAICYLSHYGLPEPPWFREKYRFPWWWLAGILAIAFVGLALRFGWARR